MSVFFSRIERDVLFYLNNHNMSSEKDILQGVGSIDSRPALKSAMERLLHLGVVGCRREVLFYLSEIGKAVIGVKEPNLYIKNEIKRRNLPQTPISLVLPESSLPKNDEQKPRDLRSLTNRKTEGTNDMKGQLPLEQHQASNEDKSEKGVSMKENLGSAQKKPLRDLPIEVTMPRSVIADWLFTESEVNFLLNKQSSNGPVAVLSAEEKDFAERSLYFRGLLKKDVSGYSLTESGQALFSEKHPRPFNTSHLIKDRVERLILELMVSLDNKSAKISILIPFLSACGENLSRSDLDPYFNSLISKKLLLKRSNNVYYLTYGARLVMGDAVMTENGVREISEMDFYQPILSNLRKVNAFEDHPKSMVRVDEFAGAKKKPNKNSKKASTANKHTSKENVVITDDKPEEKPSMKDGGDSVKDERQETGGEDVYRDALNEFEEFMDSMKGPEYPSIENVSGKSKFLENLKKHIAANPESHIHSVLNEIIGDYNAIDKFQSR